MGMVMEIIIEEADIDVGTYGNYRTNNERREQ